MSRTTPSDQLRTLQPMPVPGEGYDLDEQRTARRQIEQNFQSIASNLEETRRLTDREAIYADLEMNWITSCCCCSELSTAITPSNLEAELEALTTSDLDMSNTTTLRLGNNLIFTDPATDWQINASTDLSFIWGGTSFVDMDPNSNRMFIRDSAGTTRVEFYSLSGNPLLRLTGNLPGLYLLEDDAATDEGHTIIRMSGGQFGIYSVTDAGAYADDALLFNRNGDEWDYGELSVADMRRRTNNYASTTDIYERYYTDGTFRFERRLETGSSLYWSITSGANGDFNLYNYNATSLQDTWIVGDCSTGDIILNGNRTVLRSDTYISLEAQFNQPSGFISATTSGGYTIAWNSGYAYHLDLSGNTTVTVDGTEAKTTGLYMLQISNTSGSSWSVTWSGVDTWNGTAPTTLANNRTHYVMLHVIEGLNKSAVRVVGEALVNNVAWT